MKKSDFKDYIKETIVELLSEEGVKPEDASQYAKDMEAAAAAAERLQKALTTEDIDDDMAEPSSADLAKGDSVSTIARKLADTTKEMKTIVNQWKKAEGEEKERLLARLKELTKIKKELEGLL
jgi:hypothetical protein